MNDGLVFAAVAPQRPSRIPFAMMAVLGPLALAMLAWWFSGQAEHIDATRAMIRTSYEKRIVATELLGDLRAAESALRGYAITGDRVFLGTYERSRGDVTGNLALLGRLYADQPGQGDLVARVQSAVSARLAEMTETIRLRQQADGRVPPPIADPAARSRMESVRVATDALITAEQDMMSRRIGYVRDHNRNVQDLVWVLILLSGVILLLGLWTLWRARVHRYQLEQRAYRETVRLRAIFASTTDAIIILDPLGSIEAVNAATTRMLGYAPSELLQRDASVLLDMTDGEGGFHRRIGLIDGRLAHPNLLDRAVRHRDGHSVPVDIALGLMPLPGELHIVAAIRDISERKAAERLKDEFVATVSHELRTPLTSVVGSLGLLRAGSVGALPDAAQRLVEIAENNSRRLIRLINDILDIEKIGSGQMHFERQPLDLVKAIERGLEDSRGLAEAQNIRLELEVSAVRPLMVRGDEDRLLQVMTNLLSNAIRFSPPEGRVRVIVSSENGKAVVIVEDQGAGIPPEFQGRIFERFAQAGGSTSRGGTGLGLAISREILAAHEGRIWFGKTEGGGARLSFALPLLQDRALPARSDHARVLMCEADEDRATAIRATLEGAGCAVDRVGTAAEFEQGSESGRYDVILIDLELPDADGLETVRKMRGNGRVAGIPLIVLSAPALPRHEEAGLSGLDIVDWIAKPVDSWRLLDALRRALARSSAARPIILHVDDDADMVEVAATALADQGRILHATGLGKARELLARHVPDVVVLDLNLPDGNGLDLLPALLRPDGAAIPTIIYSAQDVLPETRDRVDAVLVKSRRSLPTLAHTVRGILAHATVATTELETP